MRYAALRARRIVQVQDHGPALCHIALDFFQNLYEDEYAWTGATGMSHSAG
jgi:hypothetical protein